MPRILESLIVSLVVVFATLSCAQNGPMPTDSPLSPSLLTGDSGQLTQGVQTGQQEGAGHQLWGYFVFRVDPRVPSVEMVPIRDISLHMNILQFLEQSPCADCLKIAGIQPGPDGTILIDISLKHPFANLNFTGFDVRGIAMFTGSHQFPASMLVLSDHNLGDAELLNADGYTSLYNPSTAGHGMEGYIKGKLSTIAVPNATLNGFKRFITDQPENIRNAFYAGDTIVAQYQIKTPSGPFVFGYAVDASWAPPINKPVDDPMTDFGPDANCPEAWQISVTDTPILGGLTDCGGSTKLTIDIYDWQGKDDAHPVLLECPELFDGTVEAQWKGDGSSFATYEAIVKNLKLASIGSYLCLIGKEPAENDPSKSWLNLTAFQTHTLNVVACDNMTLNPQDTGPHNLSYEVNNFAYCENYLYVAAKLPGQLSSEMYVFDASDPSQPVFAKSIPYPPEMAQPGIDILQLTINNGRGYLLSGYCLAIFDLYPLETAHLIKTVSFGSGDWVTSLLLGSGYAYLTGHDGGPLYVVDVDPPEDAFVATSLFAGSNVVAQLYGDHLFAYDEYYDLHIIDISIPDQTHEISYWHNPGGGGFNGMIVENGLAYMVNDSIAGNNGINIVDISDPYSPELVTMVQLNSNKGTGTMQLQSGYLYISETEATGHPLLQIVDVDPPETAHLAKSISELYLDNRDVYNPPGYLYCRQEYPPAIKVLDISDPESAEVIFEIDCPLSVFDEPATLDLDDGRMFLWNTVGIHIFDASDPVQVQHNASIYPLLSPMGVAKRDNIVIAPQEYNIALVDVTVPEEATVNDALHMGGFTSLGDITESYAWMIWQNGYLAPVNIDQVQTPYVAGLFEVGGHIQDVDVENGFAYVVTSIDFYILDVSDPANIKKVAEFSEELGWAGSVVEKDGYAYVGQWFQPKIEIYDVDPVDEAHLVTTFTSDFTQTMVVRDQYLYCLGVDAFHILDISDPVSPNLAKSIPCPSLDTRHLYLDGSYAFASDNHSGSNLDIFDIKQPETAHLETSVPLAGECNGIYVEGSYAYLALQPYGLEVLKLW